MKKILFVLFISCISWQLQAQLTQPANGGSVRGWVGEQVGLTDISINYGRPALKGRDGKIWGSVVHKGFEEDASFGKQHKIPWRAGANQSTTMEFSTDVMVEGKKLPAGKYGFFIAYDDDVCTLIFSKHTMGWGSYMYEETEDVLRVNVKPLATTETMERLTYAFSDQTDSTAVISLQWEKKKIPFIVSTALQELQLEIIARELRSDKSFNPNTYYEAASYLADHNIMLDDALKYIDLAARSMPGFYTMATKAEIQKKLKKEADSKATMAIAVKNATNPNQPYFYARQLGADQKQEAFDIFKQNYDLHPDVFITNMGMARGYSALGNNKNALKYANKALTQAPNEANKKAVEEFIKTLNKS